MILFADVIYAVSRATGVTPREIRSRDRTQRVAIARQMAMYLMRELTSESWEKIGLHVKRDHSTVMHGHFQIAKRVAAAPGFRESMAVTRTAITGAPEVNGCQA